jgi:hypothetical protein
VKAHKAGEWCVLDETMRLTHDDGWGATTPKDPREAKELTRSRVEDKREAARMKGGDPDERGG